jgi:uncharacterized membrane protein YedE/YeeE
MFPLLVGIWFGILLIKSQVISWYRIHEMFLFREAYMYQVMGSAVLVGILSVWLIRRLEARTLDGEKITIKPRPLHPGVVIGGFAFGVGWAITGACPGPIYAHIGGGNLLMLSTFLGAMAGMYLYAFLQSRLPHNEWGSPESA